MKKQFVFLAVTAGLFTSCVQNDLIAPELSEVEKGIQFQTVVAKQNSRAIITGTSYDGDAPSFGAYAFWNEISLLPGSKHYIVNEEIKHIEGKNGVHYWSSETEYLWKKDGSLTFYAYSPYRFQETAYETVLLSPSEPELGQYGFRFNNYNVAIHQETDLMVADVVWGQTANTENIAGHTGVPTVFKHKLAQVAGFILKTSEDYDGLWDGTDEENSGAVEGDIRFKIKKIQLSNIPVKGTFTSAGVEIDEEIIPENWVITSTASIEESVGESGTTPDFMTYTWYDANNTENKDGLLFGNEDSKQLHLYTPLNKVSGLNYQQPTVDNGYILAIPQEFLEGSNASLDIEYTVEKYSASTKTWINTRAQETDQFISKSMPLRAIHASKDYKGWGIGKKIYYTLDFSTEEIHWAPSVVEWANENIKVDY